MKHAWILLLLAACAAPAPVPAPDSTDADAPEAQGPAGGSDAQDGTQGASKLTGVPAIDQAQDLTARIIDARGTGRLNGVPVAAGSTSPLPAGQWMLTDAGSEYEITVRNALVPDGIVRLADGAAFLLEPARQAPRFRLYAGQASFYLPHVSLDDVVVSTPAGPLITRGAVFTVTVSPDAQVLVTCRQGEVFLTGAQNAAAVPGQVLIADGFGRGRTYAMTPGEAVVFVDHWLKIATEEAPLYFKTQLSDRVAAWGLYHDDLDKARPLAYWLRAAYGVLGAKVPGPDVWGWALTAPVESWPAVTPGPGLLGELP